MRGQGSEIYNPGDKTQWSPFGHSWHWHAISRPGVDIQTRSARLPAILEALLNVRLSVNNRVRASCKAKEQKNKKRNTPSVSPMLSFRPKQHTHSHNSLAEYKRNHNINIHMGWYQACIFQTVQKIKEKRKKKKMLPAHFLKSNFGGRKWNSHL